MNLCLQIVVDEQGQTHDLELGDSTNIGRASYNRVQIREPYMSSKHAVITRSADGTYTIEDRDSKNGTFVNDVRVEVATRISAGDTLRFGLAACTVVASEQAVSQPPVADDSPALPTTPPGPSQSIPSPASPAAEIAVSAVAQGGAQPGFLNAIQPKAKKPVRKTKQKARKKPYFAQKSSAKGRHFPRIYDPFERA